MHYFIKKKELQVMSLGFIVSIPQKSQGLPPHHACLSVQPLISGRSLTGDQFGSRVSIGLSVTTAAYVTFSSLGKWSVCSDTKEFMNGLVYKTYKTSLSVKTHNVQPVIWSPQNSVDVATWQVYRANDKLNCIG